MKFVTDAKNFVTSYTNKYTVGGLATAALTAGAAYFSPVAALTVPHVAGLGLLSLTAVAGSYALYLGAKAAYNYVFDIKTEEAPKADAEKKDEAKVEAPAVDAPKVDAPKVDAEKKDEAKVEATPEQKPGFFSRNWTKVKGWFAKTEESVKPAEEAAKPAEVAAPEAPKAVEVAAPEAPKAVEVAAPEAPKAVEVPAVEAAKTVEAPKAVEVAVVEAAKTVEAPKAAEVAATEAPKAASPRRSPRLNPVAAPVAEAVVDVEQPAATFTPARNKARVARVVDVNAKNAIHNRPRRAGAHY